MKSWYAQNLHDVVEDNPFLTHPNINQILIIIEATTTLAKDYDMAEPCHFWKGLLQDVHSEVFYFVKIIFEHIHKYPLTSTEEWLSLIKSVVLSNVFLLNKLSD